ncbi:MAG: hypothetical protein J6Q38_02565 [Clostridia bacterium]|nr:hypothetical protein [Clostridia bacterium]
MKKFLASVLAVISLIFITACKENMNNFVLKAIVTTVGEKIEVEVIESDYAFGTYLVITGEQTEFLDVNGNKIDKTNLVSGNVIEITYGGQVMMSFPPQIVANKIQVIE